MFVCFCLFFKMIAAAWEDAFKLNSCMAMHESRNFLEVQMLPK